MTERDDDGESGRSVPLAWLLGILTTIVLALVTAWGINVTQALTEIRNRQEIGAIERTRLEGRLAEQNVRLERLATAVVNLCGRIDPTFRP